MRSRALILLAAGSGLAWAQAAGAQVVPNVGSIIPDIVGPVDDRAAGKPPFEPALPADTPDEVKAIDLATPVTDLRDALVRAYWFNPQLLAERASMRASDYLLPQARAAYGPRLDYSFRLDWQHDNVDNVFGKRVAQEGHTRTAAAILSQPLFTFGRLAANERSARAQISFERARLHNAEQEVLFAAISAYVSVLRDRAGLQIARDNLDILEQEESDVRARYDVREATDADLQQVVSQAAVARAQLTTAQAALDASEADFRSAIGSPPGDLQAPNPLAIPAADLEAAQGLAELNNPLVAAAKAREQVSRAGADAAKAARLPRIDAQGRAEFGTTSPYNNRLRDNSYQAGIVVSGPIFDSGLLAARQKQAEAENDADWRLIDNALRELRAQVASTWSARRASAAAIGDLAAAVDAAQRAYEGAVTQQKAGFRTTLDVLILARDLLDVRRSYNTNLAQAYLTQAQLLDAMGSLNFADLIPDARRHDPAIRLEKVDNMGELPWTPVLDAIDGLGWPLPLKTRPIRDPALAPAADTAAPAAPVQP
jgi:outer membrane protein